MLVDTASRPGMSGAPVIRRSWTNHMVDPGVLALVDTPLNKFIGVYSGRLPTDHPHEAQVGIVWDGSWAGGSRRDKVFCTRFPRILIVTVHRPVTHRKPFDQPGRSRER